VTSTHQIKWALPDANLSQLTDEIAKWGQTDPILTAILSPLTDEIAKWGQKDPILACHFVAIYR
jgi:hypothetical protein